MLRSVGDRVDSWVGARDLAPRSSPGLTAEAFALVTRPYLVMSMMVLLVARAL